MKNRFPTDQRAKWRERFIAIARQAQAPAPAPRPAAQAVPSAIRVRSAAAPAH
jgi:hypothetical protein